LKPQVRLSGDMTIMHLIIEEIFSRFGAPIDIISANGTENENNVVKGNLERTKYPPL
jgi:hypothetical protein